MYNINIYNANIYIYIYIYYISRRRHLCLHEPYFGFFKTFDMTHEI